MALDLIAKTKYFYTDRANKFVINIFLIYSAWKLFSYYIKNSNGAVHSAWNRFLDLFGSAYALAASCVLNLFGERTAQQGISIVYLRNLASIRIEDHCLAIPATIIFIGSIALFKGNWKSKLWFIPLGILLISIINLIRIVSLCAIFEHFSRQFYQINHSLVMVILTYGLIMAMIIWWMKKFENRGQNPQPKEAAS